MSEAPDFDRLVSQLRSMYSGRRDLIERSLMGQIKRPDQWLIEQRDMLAALELAGKIARAIQKDPAGFLAFAERQGVVI